jgi:hypothetical protein
LKSAAVANCGDQGRGSDRADSWNLPESLAGFILSGRFLDNPIHLLNPCCELLQFQLELRQQNTQSVGPIQFSVFQDTRQLLIQMASALGHGQPRFQKKTANLFHYRRASHHPTLAYAMQRLQIQLFLGLDRHKTHSRSLHRSRNGFGIQGVTLVRLHGGLHLLRRDQPHFMTWFAQRLPQKVRSTTGLHANQLQLQIRAEGQQWGARTSLADHRPARCIQSNQMKDPLTQINA